LVLVGGLVFGGIHGLVTVRAVDEEEEPSARVPWRAPIEADVQAEVGQVGQQPGDVGVVGAVRLDREHVLAVLVEPDAPMVEQPVRGQLADAPFLGVFGEAAAAGDDPRAREGV
jgi:hypothetical protein